MKRRIQRPVFHLQDIVRSALDGVRDRVAVRGSEDERLQDEHIERALKKVSLTRRLDGGGHE